MIQSRIVKYYAKKDPNIAIKEIPGHFVSTHSHLNNYLDMTTMKTRQNEAERIAIAMKDYYNVSLLTQSSVLKAVKSLVHFLQVN